MALDHDRLKKTRAGSRGGAGWKPKDGENKVRILPPRSAFIGAYEQMENLAIPYDVHFFHIEGRKPTEVSRCLRELKQACPACEAYWAHNKSEDPGLKQIAGKVRAGTQYLFNILDLNNLQAGIQRWASNWTCWDKVMEIAANPQWGNVVAPEDGINFAVNMTQASRAKSGYNTYSVVPEPQHTDVTDILAGVENWEATLDNLEGMIPEPKTVAEIRELLNQMGFPGYDEDGGGSEEQDTPTPPRPIRPAAPVPAPKPVAGPKPVAPKPVAKVAAPVKIAPPKASAAAPAPVKKAAPVATSEPHYDPGPNFEEIVAESERPEGAPRCYGAYDAEVHDCQPCPVVADCQLHMLAAG